LAGSREERLAELDWALNSSAPFIMAARGGYGVHQLLPYLNKKAIAAAAKPLMGFSDITALHKMWLLAGAPVYHGPNVSTLYKLDEKSLKYTAALLSGQDVVKEIIADFNAKITAPYVPNCLLGGNLAMLASLAGTPYLYKPAEKFTLFLEDIGEAPYRLDRLLQQLLLCGYFAPVERVFLGEFVGCDPDAAAGYKAIDVLKEFVAELDIPAFAGFPTGHGEVNYPLFLGRQKSN
jgi:muramoyltetrapeptide carboxypeptidase